MTMQQENPVEIEVSSAYVEDQSEPEEDRYVFAYHVVIHNAGERSVQLLNRHWIIRDGRDQTQEVRGEGVVGEQPHIAPGDSFEYTSGTVIETPVGMMEGSYEMRDEQGHTFEATIPPFTLSVPRTLH
ncbi:MULTISPECIES: Co2+/Mg2+ efflux protein ApaG [Thioalkalivibrio]|uniref:Protein ApaG n=1 Tax=Thioalkalivibrio halophilus TaxID=252474 RepID=A0A1V2ZWM1_9GAMM|nr:MULTISPECIES: Co2+/Mg2+ efflux protein ApaG [Thioalkalivibrio]OOC09520.1 Co2+/Mg2+ efflux protein ApaG [Thioalkalivibrio halophilus]PYG02496.1 ApaG protein [Thioalkalivibrio sp. ALE21]